MITDELEQKREQLFASMMATTADVPDVPREAKAQFVRGFVGLAIDASRGDLTTRAEYLGTVIPAIKRSGMKTGTIISGMCGVAMGGALALDGNTQAWWLRFVDQYGQALGAAWDAA